MQQPIDGAWSDRTVDSADGSEIVSSSREALLMSDDRVLRGPKGEVFRFLQTTAETRGTLLEFEATLPAGVKGPPGHLHLVERESFHVVDGELAVRCGKQWQALTAGEDIAVPPGTPHTFANRSEAPTTILVRLEPPTHFEQLFRLQMTSRVPPLLKAAALNHGRTATFMVAGIPLGPQRMIWNGLAGLARLVHRDKQG